MLLCLFLSCTLEWVLTHSNEANTHTYKSLFCIFRLNNQRSTNETRRPIKFVCSFSFVLLPNSTSTFFHFTQTHSTCATWVINFPECKFPAKHTDLLVRTTSLILEFIRIEIFFGTIARVSGCSKSSIEKQQNQYHIFSFACLLRVKVEGEWGKNDPTPTIHD